jgi:hypothetical protein
MHKKEFFANDRELFAQPSITSKETQTEDFDLHEGIERSSSKELDRKTT